MGMAVTHAVTSGMGGIRTAGDLVARMQISRGMKIDAAKVHVAEKLGVSPVDLSDVMKMNEIREDLNLGTVMSRPGKAKAMEAKFRIAEVLGIKINSVERFKERASWVR
jgi:dimethylamine--corrinoid protein Co-methyltransferase